VAYNRKVEGYSNTEIDDYLDNLKNVELIDKTMRQSARMRAVQNFSTTENKKPIFGSKRNFFLRKFGKITNKEYQKTRLSPFFQTGDSSREGNRKFKLDVVENNRIIFRPNKRESFNIQLPKLSKRNRQYLCKLQELSERYETSFSVELTPNWVSVSFDEVIFKELRSIFIKDRVLSFDMNPNYIGLVIEDVDSNGKSKETVHKEVISLKKLNECKKGKTSTERVPDNNKRRYEMCEVAKYITELARHYKVQLVVFEKLDMKSNDRGNGRRYNRLVNNYWLRKLLAHNVKKRCTIVDIPVVESLPQYSSFIGVLENPDETDSIAAAFELGRRGYLFYHMYIIKDVVKGDVVYPAYDSLRLATLWKEMPVEVHSVKGWRGLYSLFKDSGLSYRVLWDTWKDLHPNEYRSLSLSSRKSNVERFVLRNDLLQFR
jgi:IS605 OrfB family transposase